MPGGNGPRLGAATTKELLLEHLEFAEDLYRYLQRRGDQDVDLNALETEWNFRWAVQKTDDGYTIDPLISRGVNNDIHQSVYSLVRELGNVSKMLAGVGRAEREAEVNIYVADATDRMCHRLVEALISPKSSQKMLCDLVASERENILNLVHFNVCLPRFKRQLDGINALERICQSTAMTFSEVLAHHTSELMFIAQYPTAALRECLSKGQCSIDELLDYLRPQTGGVAGVGGRPLSGVQQEIAIKGWFQRNRSAILEACASDVRQQLRHRHGRAYGAVVIPDKRNLLAWKEKLSSTRDSAMLEGNGALVLPLPTANHTSLLKGQFVISTIYPNDMAIPAMRVADMVMMLVEQGLLRPRSIRADLLLCRVGQFAAETQFSLEKQFGYVPPPPPPPPPQPPQPPVAIHPPHPQMQVCVAQKASESMDSVNPLKGEIVATSVMRYTDGTIPEMWVVELASDTLTNNIKQLQHQEMESLRGLDRQGYMMRVARADPALVYEFVILATLRRKLIDETSWTRSDCDFDSDMHKITLNWFYNHSEARTAMDACMRHALPSHTRQQNQLDQHMSSIRQRIPYTLWRFFDVMVMWFRTLVRLDRRLCHPKMKHVRFPEKYWDDLWCYRQTTERIMDPLVTDPHVTISDEEDYFTSLLDNVKQSGLPFPFYKRMTDMTSRIQQRALSLLTSSGRHRLGTTGLIEFDLVRITTATQASRTVGVDGEHCSHKRPRSTEAYLLYNDVGRCMAIYFLNAVLDKMTSCNTQQFAQQWIPSAQTRKRASDAIRRHHA